MLIPLPFPTCKHCGESAPKSYHRNCGGRMMVEVDTDEVYCSGCDKHWNIWESSYYCSCGGTFQAEEVADALKEVLVFCQVCAEEIRLQDEARERRREKSTASLKKFMLNLFDKIGHFFGVAVETAVNTALVFFLEKK